MKMFLPSLLLVLAATTTINAQSASDTRPPLPQPEETEQWTPVPPVVSVPASTGIPSDAIVLFDGSNLDAWVSTDKKNTTPRWTLDRKSRSMTVAAKAGNLRTKAAFGDIQLHIEWRSPTVVTKSGQHRGNSGIFFMDLYELQVLDSYNNETYPNGQAGSIYKQFPPLANACRGPGEWQTYDIVFIAPRFKDDGSLDTPARLTVFHNGVLVQNNTALRGPTEFRGLPSYKKHADKLPLALQNHGGDLVSFRNIWVRELSFPPAPPIPDLPPPPYSPAPRKSPSTTSSQ